jgi:hypothetical protein
LAQSNQTLNKDSSNYFVYNLNFRADYNAIFEHQVQFLRPNKISFGMKFTHYKYDEISSSVSVKTLDESAYGYGSLVYSITGNTIKPGIIYPIQLTSRQSIYLDLNALVSFTSHDIMLQYSKANSNSYAVGRETKMMEYGLEFGIGYSLKLLKFLYVGSNLSIGYKVSNRKYFDGIFKEISVYKYYTPAQGYSPFPVYLSPSIFIGTRLNR